MLLLLNPATQIGGEKCKQENLNGFACKYGNQLPTTKPHCFSLISQAVYKPTNPSSMLAIKLLVWLTFDLIIKSLN